MSLFYLGVLKSFFLKMSMDSFLVYLLVKEAGVCFVLMFLLQHGVWRCRERELQGKGVL